MLLHDVDEFPLQCLLVEFVLILSTWLLLLQDGIKLVVSKGLERILSELFFSFRLLLSFVELSFAFLPIIIDLKRRLADQNIF